MKKYSLIFSVVMISMLVCGVSFAQDLTDDISLPSVTLAYDGDLSEEAFTRFQAIKAHYDDVIKNTDTLTDEQIAQIDARLSTPPTCIYVYIANDTGDFFQEAYEHFSTNPNYTTEIQDIAAKKTKAGQPNIIEIINDLKADLPLPGFPLTSGQADSLQSELESLDANQVKGATGKSNDDTKRISILSFYIELTNSAPPDDGYIIHNKTTVVIATTSGGCPY